MDTYMEKASAIDRKWYVVDAKGQILGRLAARVARILRGKHKPTYTPFLDCGDYVIIINAEKIKVSGRKLEQKEYFRHSDYVGGAKSVKLADMLADHPERVLEHAIKGMLPKGALGNKMYKKLFVSCGPEHNHQAQKPVELKF